MSGSWGKCAPGHRPRQGLRSARLRVWVDVGAEASSASISASMAPMQAIHIRDVPTETVAALKRRAARRGHSMQQELREVLARAAAEPDDDAPPRQLRLRTVSTGRTGMFDRAGFYDDDER